MSMQISPRSRRNTLFVYFQLKSTRPTAIMSGKQLTKKQKEAKECREQKVAEFCLKCSIIDEVFSMIEPILLITNVIAKKRCVNELELH